MHKAVSALAAAAAVVVLQHSVSVPVAFLRERFFFFSNRHLLSSKVGTSTTQLSAAAAKA